jgi:hypothetical protein
MIMILIVIPFSFIRVAQRMASLNGMAVRYKPASDRMCISQPRGAIDARESAIDSALVPGYALEP